MKPVRECDRLTAADRTFRTSECGLSRLQLGDGDAAVAELRAMVGSDSESGTALGALGYAYGRTGRRPEALRVLDGDAQPYRPRARRALLRRGSVCRVGRPRFDAPVS